MLTPKQYSKPAKSVNPFLLALFKWNCGGSIFGGIAALLLLLVLMPIKSFAATATYHLHNEASSTSGLLQLKTAGPDTTAVALSTVLTNKAVAEYLVKAFDTQAGVPNTGGVIVSGSTVSFTIWMNKTASVGTMYPRAKLYLNSASGSQLCTATGTTALTTTLTKYSLSCTTSTAITMSATDRFYLWTGVNLTKKSTSTFSAVVEIEGTLNGNYDSLVVAPLPSAPIITTLSPTSGPMGTSVTITGTNFGTPQGASLVTFNGLTATTSSWSTTRVVAAVPTGATTGPVVVTVGGSASNGVTFTVTVSISSLSPSSGLPGTPVTITGTNFGTTQGPSTVTFNGLSATPSSWSDTSITTTVPTGAATGPVVATVGGVASNGVTFTVTPTISTLSPTSGATGTSITVNGTNFGSTQGTSALSFNGISATTTSWSTTKIVAAVPSTASTGPVVVTVGGSASNGVTFTVTPSITTLSPTSGAVATAVTITGTGFGSTQGTSTVTFNGISATTSSWSTTRIVAAVPSGATTGPVVVTAGGNASNGVTFTVSLSIYSLFPSAGSIGASVSINGTSFGTTQGSSTVTFNGISATTSSWSNTTIVATVPTGATTGPVVVKVGSTSSNGVTFTVVPAISSLSPTSGQVGSAVTITGTNFGATQGTSTLTFNGISATTSSWSTTKIVTTVPASATSGPVVVSVGGNASNSVTFTVTISISSLSPNSGQVGTTVTITGTQFGSSQGTSTVTFNGILASTTSWSNSTIVTAVPSGTTTGPVVVTVGGIASNSLTFVVPPVITSISPKHGARGTIIYIYGNNFGATVGSSVITVNGTTAFPSSWSNTLVLAQVLAGTSLTPGPVTITINSVMSNAMIFSTDLPPGIITTAVGKLPTTTNTGDGGPAAVATTLGPLDIASNANDKFYISTGSSIRMVDKNGYITTVAGTGAYGFSGDGGPAVNALIWARGIGVDGLGNLFIADFYNNRVRKVDVGGVITTVAGTGIAGYSGDGGPATSAQLSPNDVAIDNNGNLYITDGSRIRKVDSSGTITTIAGTGVAGYSGDGGPAINAQISSPYGITVDGFGNVLIADTTNNRVRKIDTNGIITTVAGTGVYGNTGDGGSATSAQLGYPYNMVVDPRGNLFIATYSFSVVRRVDPNGIISTIAGTGGTGLGNYSNGIPATSESLGHLQGVDLDYYGNILIADPSNYVVAKVGADSSWGLPYITSITPSSGTYGTQVTINGSFFGSNNDGNGGLSIGGWSANVLSWSPHSIVATVPNNATTGPAYVVVYGPSYTGVSNGFNFTILSSISSVSPSSGIEGTSVTISGSSFGTSQGISTVTFNGAIATPTSWSNTSIVVPVPPGATTGPIVVTQGGVASNGVNFTVLPNINSLSPSLGVPGSPVTISGSGFGATQGTSTVSFNGLMATPLSWNNTSIVVTVPFGATSGPVVVTVGGHASNGMNFVITLGISSISPATGPVGTSVVISGSSFGATQAGSTVTFNGVVATPSSWSNNSIVVSVPAGASSGPVVVTVGGLGSSSIGFTIPLYINTISPLVGSAGTSVTITGSSFGTSQGTSTVTFNGTLASPTTWSDNSIVVPAPAGLTTGPVIVTVGGIASNSIAFSVSPQINLLSPQTGLIGTSVTISGARFGSTQGSSTISFNGTVATPTSWSDTSIVVPVPSGTTTGSVVVTVGGISSTGVTFTVLQITITYPTPGMVLNQPSTVVYGSLPTVNGDFKVIVNGKYAMVNGQSFAINNVNLALGQNTITATLTDQTGESATGSVIVQSNSQNAYVQLKSGLEMSLAPMTSTLSLQSMLTSAITQVDLVVGNTDLGLVNFPYQVTMPTPGIKIATVTVTTADSLTYQGQFAFNVLDPIATEALLRTKWTNMQTALLGGDMTTALNYFALRSQGNYQSILTQLQSVLPQIFNTIDGVYLLSVSNEIAEMAALRNEGGRLMSYSIHFVLDETGTWRINNF